MELRRLRNELLGLRRRRGLMKIVAFPQDFKECLRHWAGVF